jgi:predicted translin family RNA/ssDNA-binding protein
MKSIVKQAQDRFEAFERNRARCMRVTGELRSEAKAAINFIVKGEMQRAREALRAAAGMMRDLGGWLRKDPYLYSVPSLNEGLEEYVEARLLLSYVEGGKRFPSMRSLGVNHEAYICGLCDMTGELVRIAMSRAEAAPRIARDVSALVDQCIRMYVTRNSKIRSKLQDLERNLRRLEEILYERRP